MPTKQEKPKRFRVYYFYGDYFSSEGEQRGSTIIEAKDEREAEWIFKHSYTHRNFGWVEEAGRGRRKGE